MKPQKSEHLYGRVLLHHKLPAEILPWLQRLEQEAQLKEVIVFCYRPEEIFTGLLALLPMIDAAGGVVWQDGRVLFIHRHGKWDLPKGKIEEGEPSDLAAMREVEEECGVSGLVLGRFIDHTYHTYWYKQRMVVKRTFWYEMQTDFRGVLVPQLEEGITEVRWIGPEDWESLVLTNTFNSIGSLLQPLLAGARP